MFMNLMCMSIPKNVGDIQGQIFKRTIFPSGSQKLDWTQTYDPTIYKYTSYINIHIYRTRDQ